MSLRLCRRTPEDPRNRRSTARPWPLLLFADSDIGEYRLDKVSIAADDGGWIALSVEGATMKKLNTYQFYSLATKIHPLVTLSPVDTEFSKLFVSIYNASTALRPYIGDKGMFPPSSRHAAIDLVRLLDAAGLEDWGKNPAAFDMKKVVRSWEVAGIRSRASDLETVFANDLPGLDTYYVSRKGIYSTPDLIERAELAITDGLSREACDGFPHNVIKDFNQAGRCLAFELPTAAGFHTMRSVEAHVRLYWNMVRKPPEETREPEMAQCINELRASGENAKLMDILDHVRDLHRNALMHPEVFLEMPEALRLFDISKSAISAVAERICELKKDAELEAEAETVAASNGDEELPDEG